MRSAEHNEALGTRSWHIFCKHFWRDVSNAVFPVRISILIHRVVHFKSVFEFIGQFINLCFLEYIFLIQVGEYEPMTNPVICLSELMMIERHGAIPVPLATNPSFFYYSILFLFAILNLTEPEYLYFQFGTLSTTIDWPIYNV